MSGKKPYVFSKGFAFCGASLLCLACGSDSTIITDTSQESEALLPMYDVFREEARTVIAGREVYVVEGDMAFDTEKALLDYYYSMESGSVKGDKSIVNWNAGTRDVWTDSDPSTDVIDVTFCFDNSSWGGTESGDSDGDGTSNEPLPTKAGVLGPLSRGLAAWEGVANLRVTYQSANDGASCGASDTFVVTLDPTSNCTATGFFPSAASQQLVVPVCGLTDIFTMHEAGHLLGLRHEHIHSGDPNSCSEGDVLGTDYEELTGFDPDSAMIYFNCQQGPDGNPDEGPDGIPGTADDPAVQDDQVIAGNRVSRLDGIGARELYGPPQWWWAVLVK